jgi:uncharacterized membrane protein
MGLLKMIATASLHCCVRSHLIAPGKTGTAIEVLDLARNSLRNRHLSRMRDRDLHLLDAKLHKHNAQYW